MSVRTTFKPRDVEEPIDFWLNRPLASLLVKALARTPITPNQVTILSGTIGMIAGAVIGSAPLHGSYQVAVGGALLYLSILLDCADGQLARLRGEASMFGRFLDGVVDVAAIGATFLGFAVLLYRAGYGFWFIQIVGWSAGYSMKWHVHGYDHAKNLFLANTRPESERPKALPTLEEIARERDRLAALGDRLGALFVGGFIRFSRSQRQGWQKGRIGLGARAPADDRERALYRDRFSGTMKLWTWDGLGLHLFMFVIASFTTPFFVGSSVVVWFIYLVPMNLLTAFILFREKAIERTLQAELHGPGAGETVRT